MYETVHRMEEAGGEGRRWVLKRGVRMGKQILVAGLLASTAPVVVPPLVVVSVIGISVSIPFGLFLASHACTHKLMSKLLPMPATPSYDVRIEVCQKEWAVTQTTRGAEMEEASSPAANDQKEEDPQSSDNIKQVDESDITASHKPVPSLETADETVGLNQESSCPGADVQNTSRSGYSSAAPINSNEVTVNEEKLWKDINAIRVIVGYEGTSQTSCMDELKKLYILAGVEPPSLLTASGNSYEIHHHLHFLMSVLGVKSNGP